MAATGDAEQSQSALADMFHLAFGTLLLAALAPVSTWAQPDIATIQESIVQVAVLDGETTKRLGSGFAVTGQGHVATVAHLVAGEDQIVVAPLASRAELVARLVSRDERAGIALLAVNGLGVPPLQLAMDGFDPGRRVVSAGVWPGTGATLPVAEVKGDVRVALALGSVGALEELPARDSSKLTLIAHNAMIPAAGYGGPLLNDCGEVAGINRGSPGVSTRRLRRGQAPEDVVYALSAPAVGALLEAEGVEFERSDQPCVAALAEAQAQAEATSAELDRRTEALEEATGQVEATREQLDETEREKQAADERAADAQARVGELEAQYEEALRTGSEQAEALEAELEAARDEQEAAREAADTLEGRVASLTQQLEQRAVEDRFRLIATMVGAGVVLGAVVFVAFILYRRHTRQLAVAQDEAAHARREALDAQAESDAAPLFPDFLLSGETDGGKAVSLKLPGALLGRGVVVGRSPRNSTLLIDDRTLSREHARFSGHGDSVQIEDLGSTNGTKVNGHALEAGVPVTIKPGDVLQLGAVNVRFTEMT